VVRISDARDLRVKGFIVVRRWVRTCAWKISFLRLRCGGFVTRGLVAVAVLVAAAAGGGGREEEGLDCFVCFLVVVDPFDFSTTAIDSISDD